GGIEHGHVLDAVLERLGVDRLELGNIGVLGDDEQLAELAMGNAVRGAIGVKQTARTRTVQGLLAAGRIVEPGVNDLAVARRRAGADAGSSLRHDHVVAAQRPMRLTTLSRACGPTARVRPTSSNSCHAGHPSTWRLPRKRNGSTGAPTTVSTAATEARLMMDTTFFATSEKLCPGACRIFG